MKKLINLHKFFVKESYSYINPFRFKDYLYYPIAYIKFMYYSLKNS
jgi:hypothetical protein